MVIADAMASLSGRGAWVHPTRDCIDTALKRKAFGRALKAQGNLDVSQVNPPTS
jgi:predicted RNA-binding protein YlxR (DUF448 family)